MVKFRWLKISAAFVGALFIAWFDYATGPAISFSIFYLVPIACLRWYVGRAPSLVLAVFSAVLWGLVDDSTRSLPFNQVISFWNASVRLFYFVLVTMVLGYWQREHELKVAEQEKMTADELRRLTAHLQSIREEERARIARQIHDDVGQDMAALKMEVSLLQKKQGQLSIGESSQKLEEMKGMIDQTLQSTRRMASGLRSAVLDQLGLVEAIEWQTKEFASKTGIVCRFQKDIGELALDASKTIAIFRIYQEMLLNVSQHAQAKHVDIRLDDEDGNFNLIVQDDGRGIAPEKIKDPLSLGLLGMRERAQFLGGRLTILPAAGQGTVVQVTVPLPE